MTTPTFRFAQQLEAALQGRLIRPTDADYDEARAVWNGMIDHYPALIARCKTVADVIETIHFAREHKFPVSVRGGGHNVAGSAIVENGVVIDLSDMNSVYVDPRARIARVEGGARLRDLDRATQPYGLAVPAGVMSDTGIGGLTLGGGTGWLSRKYGLTIDNLISAMVVTAEGRLLKASETENPDLFWGLRGGGGGLGVVTSFEFCLRPIGPQVMSVGVFYPGDEAPEILRQYLAFSAAAPDEASVLVSQGHIPAVDMFPAQYHGQRFIFLAGCYAGPVDEGQRVMQPLREFATPIQDFSGVTAFTELQQLWDEEYPSGTLRYYWRALHLNRLDEAAIQRLIMLVNEAPSPLTTLDIGQLGGAVARVPQDATAYPHRSAPYVLFIESNWADPADDDANIGWARRVVDAMQPFSDGSQYANFPGLLEDQEKWFGTNYQRLQSLKAQYDPTGLFRIPRAGSTSS